MRTTIIALLLVDLCAHAQEGELAALVDTPPKARRKAALDLAKRKSIGWDALIGAMRGFEPRGGRDGRRGTFEVDGSPVITMHVPERYDGKRPAPLILALHGAGGHGPQEARRWRGVADDLGMLVAAPTDGGDNAGYAFTGAERDETMAALRWVRRHYNVDENRIHLTGVSRGGHMTWDLGTRHPDRWASLAPMVGGPRLDLRKGQNNLRYLENVAHLPIRDLQGEGDDKRMIFNLRLAFSWLKKFGAGDAELMTFPELGHSFRFEAVEWETFFAKHARDPRPPRVVRMAANKDERRAYWVEILKTARDVRETFTPKVAVSEWNGMDDGAKRRFLADAALKRTARIEAEMAGPGEFVVKSTGVRSFRLLLTEDMFEPDTPVKVTWNGRVKHRKLRPSRRVALTEFAERFDRTFLPVAELKVP